MRYDPFQNRTAPRVGAFPGPFPGPSGTSCDANMTAVAAAAAAVGQSGNCRIRRAILGLKTAAVLANSEGTSETQPQKPFRGLRLVIPSTTATVTLADAIDVIDVSVSMMPQLASKASSQPIPGKTFVETSVDSAFTDFDWCPTSEKISVTVSNVTANAVDFKAALLGLILES